MASDTNANEEKTSTFHFIYVLETKKIDARTLKRTFRIVSAHKWVKSLISEITTTLWGLKQMRQEI